MEYAGLIVTEHPANTMPNGRTIQRLTTTVDAKEYEVVVVTFPEDLHNQALRDLDRKNALETLYDLAHGRLVNV